MTRRPDLSIVLMLRTRREDRAAAAMARAVCAVEHSRSAVVAAEDALRCHDTRQAALDARFEAVSALSHADLNLVRERVLHADLGRAALTADIDAAREGGEHAVAAYTACRAEWLATRARTEALRDMAARDRRAAQGRHDARTEDEGAW